MSNARTPEPPPDGLPLAWHEEWEILADDETGVASIARAALRALAEARREIAEGVRRIVCPCCGATVVSKR